MSGWINRSFQQIFSQIGKPKAKDEPGWMLLDSVVVFNDELGKFALNDSLNRKESQFLQSFPNETKQTTLSS